jgi:hypothetical protein
MCDKKLIQINNQQAQGFQQDSQLATLLWRCYDKTAMSLPHDLSVIARVTRVAELASAAVSQWGYLNPSTCVDHDSLKIVVGIVGHFLHYYEDNTAYPNVRLVYTEVVAVLSMLCSILWIVFCTAESYSVGANLFISLAWFAAFGSLMEYVNCHHCTTSPFNIHYRNKIGNGLCKEWRVTEAFAFITGVFSWEMPSSSFMRNSSLLRGDQPDLALVSWKVVTTTSDVE